MIAIVLTQQQNTDLFDLIEEYFTGTDYNSFANFKVQENRNIVTMKIKNDLFVLSPTVLTDPIYAELKDFILSKTEMIEPRTIEQSELLTDEI